MLLSTIPATVIDDPTVNGATEVVAKVNVAAELATDAPVTVRFAPSAVLSAYKFNDPPILAANTP